MDFGKRFPLFMFMIMVWFGVSSGVLYNVGDSYGWNSHSNFDYMAWASSKEFHLGDLIHFEYDPKVDNVVRVNHWDFRACNATNPIAVMNSGNDTILIRNPHSHLYYISSTPGHCQAGQKVDIRVHRSSSPPPSSSPSPSPSSSPSLSPSSPDALPIESSARASIHRSTAMALVATQIMLVIIGVFVY